MVPIYKIVLGEDGGMNAVSLVEDPAIEIDFLAFDKDSNIYKFNFSEDRHEIFGPICVPDMLIYRFSEKIGEYYVKFSKDTIEQMMLKYSKDNLFNSLNFSHNNTDKIDNIFLIESFLKDTDKGIDPTDFKDCPNGTWFMKMKVCDDNIWNTIKNTDKFKGFSLEGMFEIEKEEPKLTNEIDIEDIDEMLNELYKN